MDHLESFIAECDRRTELAKKRLAETQEEISAEVSAKAEKVHELNEEIGKLLAKAEQLGAEGNVDESQKILMEVEKVRAKKKEAEEEYRNSMPASSFQQQKLRVCEVCSAYLGLHDNDRRLADHFGGKLHLGFIQIREKLDQLRVWIKNQRSQEVALPGPASKEVKICLQGATKIIPVPVPRQTPAPPQPFPEPQPGPPPGFQGPECEIQVTTLTPSVAATRSSPESGRRGRSPGSTGAATEGLLTGGWRVPTGRRLLGGRRRRRLARSDRPSGPVNSLSGARRSRKLPFVSAEHNSSFVVYHFYCFGASCGFLEMYRVAPVFWGYVE
ncbi:putative RNA-binding protein Luc7-like 1 isoform X1 [Suricata suricatta]|nr:putative RNA-binding protein Luc7-like 1 isoform X1 [Suricata suricatta]XP_029801970.1 putative RNA-binding protein Luc7-like 1 isoform X1 [Suricata suricatta]XP_029801971.1 putative RNA-binding protein Luc7-like 1 isoform X1 [Suricata suricatta]XP_029801972.1 putative RNA-binding protein Luc7-like 1 isoform X1 [Suricata suricatta]